MGCGGRSYGGRSLVSKHFILSFRQGFPLLLAGGARDDEKRVRASIESGTSITVQMERISASDGHLF